MKKYFTYITYLKYIFFKPQWVHPLTSDRLIASVRVTQLSQLLLTKCNVSCVKVKACVTYSHDSMP